MFITHQLMWDKHSFSCLRSEMLMMMMCCCVSVLDVVYWRDVRWSAAVFSFSLLLLLSLSCCSVISVMAYTTLALLSLTVTFRIYKAILQAVQKSDRGHPFKQYLDKDVALSTDVVQKYSDVALRGINGGLIELRRLFLVEDLVDSLKAQIDAFISMLKNQMKDFWGKIQAKVPGMKKLE
ncbi:putative reticulon-4 [Triplophysa rosa]|uniref:Reticulon n=1 Tax=Triplophysa rosa TaxID=992332 RepID=A0A9W7WNQ9_TRIRA|nr:putative reticulon-4 [Triplophysa rosa]